MGRDLHTIAAELEFLRRSEADLLEGPEISIIVPTFNEVENVPIVVARVAEALAGIRWEAIFVDDDSPDGTAAATRRLALTDPRVRCLRRIGRRGLAGACIEGMLASSASIVAVMDADLQHDETLLPRMLDSIQQGADLAIGTRFAGGGSAQGGLSLLRQRGSQFAIEAARRLLGVRLSDQAAGQRAIVSSQGMNRPAGSFHCPPGTVQRRRAPPPIRIFAASRNGARRVHLPARLSTSLDTSGHHLMMSGVNGIGTVRRHREFSQCTHSHGVDSRIFSSVGGADVLALHPQTMAQDRHPWKPRLVLVDEGRQRDIRRQWLT